ncbi:aminodeoxychorismate synthase component I [Aliidiomarina sanyensis]|uniref:aminodeoxychorismate synthase n=1 Tax=Aliidiomarina sanyensis TaxID=1249555 RepID=A0A432WNJ7_9GAMM|nr:aminodeoxychorismate synthase component I [Aliidiomarina sanyensis]RUO35267.1 aminodeoxychorismate synthase, component I [Aliidiomarina sanyensis]
MSESVAFHSLPYADWHDALAVFAPFANEPWALLLDSAGAEHPNSRFAILLRQPDKTYTYTHDALNEATGDDPFTFLSQWLPARSEQSIANEDIPFQGGLAGLFGYDAGRAIERLPAHQKRDLPIPDIAVGFYRYALVIDHKLKRVTAVTPAECKVSPSEFWTASTPHFSRFHLRSSWQSNLSETQYHARINQIHDYLRAGDCYQINLAQRFAADFAGHPWLAYVALRDANQAPFSAYFNLPEGQILSVSPERFLEVSPSGLVETRPIKGTRPRYADPRADQASKEALQASAKDQAENLMIVDLLRNDLSRVCQPGSVHVPELFKIESFHAVHHSVSTVRGQLAPTENALTLIKAAFPGGSITGAPKIRAMEIIDELEPHRRSVYCGSIGYFSQHGHADTSITIRTLCAADQTLYCWAGGGIVIDSDAANEYQETFDKVARILPVLAELSGPLSLSTK